MTRKARCGNTQKHKKMPGEATPWEELSRDVKANVVSDKDPAVNKVKPCSKGKHPTKNSENELSTVIEKVNPSESSTNQATGTINPSFSKNNGKISDKKRMFQEKLKKRRLENGVTLLAPKQERKIYLIKKKLRKKGLPPDVIKDIIRKKRRSEELLFRKTFTTKICFNCRERGHLVSNCPISLASNQTTGICFKCGSTEHSSYNCQTNVEGYPLAKCFVCKEEGHISKDCPKNKRGVYVNGGCCNICGHVDHLQKDCPTVKRCCNICGKVNHLRKDCPTLGKKKAEPIPVYTLNEITSMDADEKATVTSKKEAIKPKVVKF